MMPMMSSSPSVRFENGVDAMIAPSPPFARELPPALRRDGCGDAVVEVRALQAAGTAPRR
jgi:hypothetical protein